MNLIKLIFLLIACVFCTVNGSKILMVCSLPSKSHYILMSSLARGLVKAGHDVTMVSSFGEENPPKGGTYRDIILTGFQENPFNVSSAIYFQAARMNPFELSLLAFKMGVGHTNRTLGHPNVQKLIKSNEKFDVVIIEQIGTDAQKVLAYHFKAPLIVFHSQGATPWVNRLVGNPAPLSYISDPNLKYPINMTFWQRLVNALVSPAMELLKTFIYDSEQSKLLKLYFPDAPDYNTINRNISLMLLNSHESINQAVPHVPSMVQIGGFHVTPSKKLPDDLQKFLNEAKDGVIYFSLGTNVLPSLMEKETRDAIINALAKLKQKVLWKFDKDEFEGLPKNVKISKWFPQNDILGHPNIKLFITHGGLLSTLETVYHGVPCLGLPVFADQMVNSHRMEESGIGINLPFIELTEENFSQALDRLIKDPRYQENAKQRSSLMHDRPLKPLDEAVYWVEFVIRHGGVTHLRIAGLDLPWYKYYLLDVGLFAAAVIWMFLSILCISCKCCKKGLCLFKKGKHVKEVTPKKSGKKKQKTN